MQRTTQTARSQPVGPWVRLRDISLTAVAFAFVLAFVFDMAPQDEEGILAETYAMLAR